MSQGAPTNSGCWVLFIFTMWLLNFFLVERTLKQELQGKETSDKRKEGEFDHHAILHHQAVLHILLLPILPPISSLSLSSSSFFSSSFSFSSSVRRFKRPLGPPSPAGTCRTGTGSLHTGLASFSPRFQNNDRFEIIHKLQNIDRDHKALIFRYS